MVYKDLQNTTQPFCASGCGMRTAEGTLKIFKFTNVVPDYQIDSIFLAFNLKKKWGLLIHLNSVVCC